MQELLAVCALVGMEFNEKDPLLINLTSLRRSPGEEEQRSCLFLYFKFFTIFFILN